MRTVVAVALLVVALGGCGLASARHAARPAPTGPAATPAPADHLWPELRARPLGLPSMAAGDPCPVSAWREADGWRLLGAGPIYLVDTGIFGSDRRLRYGPGAEDGRVWHKSGWMRSPAYAGPALLPGHRLDGPEEPRFYRSSYLEPLAELGFPVVTGTEGVACAPPLPAGWRFLPSGLGLRSPGCCGVQVDGTGFTETLVFEAGLDPRPPREKYRAADLAPLSSRFRAFFGA